MTLAPRLTLSQKQRLTLTPHMRQSLAILRLSASDLADRIEAELQANPFLRRDTGSFAADGRAVTLTDILPAQPGLYARLLQQIGLMRLPADVRAAAEYLAGSLREDGYLDTSLAEIADESGLTPATVSAGLAALHACDPAGVGARDLPECLVLQLVDRGVDPELARAAIARMPDFAARRWTRLARDLNLSRDAVRGIAALLPGLTARPVTVDHLPVAVLRGDLVARCTEAGVLVEAGPESLPRLRLDSALAASVDTDPALAEVRDRAVALIAAIDQRRATLVRIGRHLAQVQPAVFFGDPGGMRPLSRRAVADALGLHPATIGRAVAGKAVDIDGRLVALSAFFSAALGGADGRPVAAGAVRDRLVALVAAEPADAPLSDAQLCDALRAEGVDIARRTVAKYRRVLRLPTAARRRRCNPGKGATAQGVGDDPAARRADEQQFAEAARARE